MPQTEKAEVFVATSLKSDPKYLVGKILHGSDGKCGLLQVAYAKVLPADTQNNTSSTVVTSVADADEKTHTEPQPATSKPVALRKMVALKQIDDTYGCELHTLQRLKGSLNTLQMLDFYGLDPENAPPKKKEAAPSADAATTKKRRPQMAYLLITELCAGGDLCHALTDWGDANQTAPWLPEHLVKRLMRQIATGLLGMKKQRVIHRDLKLENIFLTDFDLFSAEAKIGDFGLSKFFEGETTVDTEEDKIHATEKEGTSDERDNQTHRDNPLAAQKGNTFTCSPERLLGLEYSYGTDVWSTGILLYALLCGVYPWSTGGVASKADYLSRILNALPQRCLGSVGHALLNTGLKDAAATFKSEIDGSSRNVNHNTNTYAASVLGGDLKDATGALFFPYPVNMGLSTEAKDLVLRMLCVNPHERINIEDILKHPWLAQSPSASTSPSKTKEPTAANVTEFEADGSPRLVFRLVNGPYLSAFGHAGKLNIGLVPSDTLPATEMFQKLTTSGHGPDSAESKFVPPPSLRSFLDFGRPSAASATKDSSSSPTKASSHWHRTYRSASWSPNSGERKDERVGRMHQHSFPFQQLLASSYDRQQQMLRQLKVGALHKVALAKDTQYRGLKAEIDKLHAQAAEESKVQETDSANKQKPRHGKQHAPAMSDDEKSMRARLHELESEFEQMQKLSDSFLQTMPLNLCDGARGGAPIPPTSPYVLWQWKCDSYQKPSASQTVAASALLTNTSAASSATGSFAAGATNSYPEAITPFKFLSNVYSVMNDRSRAPGTVPFSPADPTRVGMTHGNRNIMQSGRATRPEMIAPTQKHLNQQYGMPTFDVNVHAGAVAFTVPLPADGSKPPSKRNRHAKKWEPATMTHLSICPSFVGLKSVLSQVQPMPALPQSSVGGAVLPTATVETPFYSEPIRGNSHAVLESMKFLAIFTQKYHFRRDSFLAACPAAGAAVGVTTCVGQAEVAPETQTMLGIGAPTSVSDEIAAGLVQNDPMGFLVQYQWSLGGAGVVQIHDVLLVEDQEQQPSENELKQASEESSTVPPDMASASHMAAKRSMASHLHHYCFVSDHYDLGTLDQYMALVHVARERQRLEACVKVPTGGSLSGTLLAKMPWNQAKHLLDPNVALEPRLGAKATEAGKREATPPPPSPSYNSSEPNPPTLESLLPGFPADQVLRALQPILIFLRTLQRVIASGSSEADDLQDGFFGADVEEDGEARMLQLLKVGRGLQQWDASWREDVGGVIYDDAFLLSHLVAIDPKMIVVRRKRSDKYKYGGPLNAAVVSDEIPLSLDEVELALSLHTSTDLLRYWAEMLQRPFRDESAVRQIINESNARSEQSQSQGNQNGPSTSKWAESRPPIPRQPSSTAANSNSNAPMQPTIRPRLLVVESTADLTQGNRTPPRSASANTLAGTPLLNTPSLSPQHPKHKALGQQVYYSSANNLLGVSSVVGVAETSSSSTFEPQSPSNVTIAPNPQTEELKALLLPTITPHDLLSKPLLPIEARARTIFIENSSHIEPGTREESPERANTDDSPPSSRSRGPRLRMSVAPNIASLEYSISILCLLLCNGSAPHPQDLPTEPISDDEADGSARQKLAQGSADIFSRFAISNDRTISEVFNFICDEGVPLGSLPLRVGAWAQAVRKIAATSLAPLRPQLFGKEAEIADATDEDMALAKEAKLLRSLLCRTSKPSPSLVLSHPYYAYVIVAGLCNQFTMFEQKIANLHFEAVQKNRSQAAAASHPPVHARTVSFDQNHNTENLLPATLSAPQPILPTSTLINPTDPQFSQLTFSNVPVTPQSMTGNVAVATVLIPDGSPSLGQLGNNSFGLGSNQNGFSQTVNRTEPLLQPIQVAASTARLFVQLAAEEHSVAASANNSAPSSGAANRKGHHPRNTSGSAAAGDDEHRTSNPNSNARQLSLLTQAIKWSRETRNQCLVCRTATASALSCQSSGSAKSPAVGAALSFSPPPPLSNPEMTSCAPTEELAPSLKHLSENTLLEGVDSSYPMATTATVTTASTLAGGTLRDGVSTMCSPLGSADDVLSCSAPTVSRIFSKDMANSFSTLMPHELNHLRYQCEGIAREMKEVELRCHAKAALLVHALRAFKRGPATASSANIMASTLASGPIDEDGSASDVDSSSYSDTTDTDGQSSYSDDDATSDGQPDLAPITADEISEKNENSNSFSNVSTPKSSPTGQQPATKKLRKSHSKNKKSKPLSVPSSPTDADHHNFKFLVSPTGDSKDLQHESPNIQSTTIRDGPNTAPKEATLKGSTSNEAKFPKVTPNLTTINKDSGTTTGSASASTTPKLSPQTPSSSATASPQSFINCPRCRTIIRTSTENQAKIAELFSTYGSVSKWPADGRALRELVIERHLSTCKVVEETLTSRFIGERTATSSEGTNSKRPSPQLGPDHHSPASSPPNSNRLNSRSPPALGSASVAVMPDGRVMEEVMSPVSLGPTSHHHRNKGHRHHEAPLSSDDEDDTASPKKSKKSSGTMGERQSTAEFPIVQKSSSSATVEGGPKSGASSPASTNAVVSSPTTTTNGTMAGSRQPSAAQCVDRHGSDEIADEGSFNNDMQNAKAAHAATPPPEQTTIGGLQSIVGQPQQQQPISPSQSELAPQHSERSKDRKKAYKKASDSHHSLHTNPRLAPRWQRIILQVAVASARGAALTEAMRVTPKLGPSSGNLVPVAASANISATQSQQKLNQLSPPPMVVLPPSTAAANPSAAYNYHLGAHKYSSMDSVHSSHNNNVSASSNAVHPAAATSAAAMGSPVNHSSQVTTPNIGPTRQQPQQQTNSASGVSGMASAPLNTAVDEDLLEAYSRAQRIFEVLKRDAVRRYFARESRAQRRREAAAKENGPPGSTTIVIPIPSPSPATDVSLYDHLFDSDQDTIEFLKVMSIVDERVGALRSYLDHVWLEQGGAPLYASNPLQSRAASHYHHATTSGDGSAIGATLSPVPEAQLSERQSLMASAS